MVAYSRLFEIANYACPACMKILPFEKIGEDLVVRHAIDAECLNSGKAFYVYRRFVDLLEVPKEDDKCSVVDS